MLFLRLLILFFLVLNGILLAVQADTCQCSCCSGPSCTYPPPYVGAVPVSSCSACTEAVCETNFPSSCIANNGIVSAACSSSSSTGSTSGGGGAGTVWAGTYQVEAGCETQVCCCLTGSVTVTQSGNYIYLNSPLTGQCQGQTNLNSGPIALASSTSDSASFVYGGNSYLVTRSGLNLEVQDQTYTACSGSAVCIGGACLNGGSSTSGTGSGSSIGTGSSSSTTGGGGNGGDHMAGWEIALIVVTCIVGTGFIIGAVVLYVIYGEDRGGYQSISS